MFYFFYGTTPFLEFEIEKIMKKINEEHKNLKVRFFDCSLKEEENFFNSIQTNSIFSSLECLFLKRAEILKSSGIAKIIKSIKEYNISQKIIIISYNLPILYDKAVAEYELSKASIKVIEDSANFIDCTNTKEKEKIFDYIKQKLKISDKECKYLAECLPSDYYIIKNEIDKISTFLDGESYSFEKIKNLISLDKEYNLKDSLEEFLKTENPSQILEYLNKNKDAYMGLIYIMADELINFLKISSLIEEGKIAKDISYNVFKQLYEEFSDLFIGRNFRAQHPYTIFLKLTNFNIEDKNFYIKNLRALLQLEYRMKSGEGDVDMEFPLYLMKFFEKNEL